MFPVEPVEHPLALRSNHIYLELNGWQIEVAVLGCTLLREHRSFRSALRCSDHIGGGEGQEAEHMMTGKKRISLGAFRAFEAYPPKQPFQKNNGIYLSRLFLPPFLPDKLMPSLTNLQKGYPDPKNETCECF